MDLRVQWTTWNLQEETDVSDSQPDIQALLKGMEVEGGLVGRPAFNAGEGVGLGHGPAPATATAHRPVSGFEAVKRNWGSGVCAAVGLAVKTRNAPLVWG
jgi:hypothetical protein